MDYLFYWRIRVISLTPSNVCSINMFFVDLPSLFSLDITLSHVLDTVDLLVFTEVGGNHIISFTSQTYPMIVGRKYIFILSITLYTTILKVDSFLMEIVDLFESLLECWYRRLVLIYDQLTFILHAFILNVNILTISLSHKPWFDSLLWTILW